MPWTKSATCAKLCDCEQFVSSLHDCIPFILRQRLEMILLFEICLHIPFPAIHFVAATYTTIYKSDISSRTVLSFKSQHTHCNTAKKIDVGHNWIKNEMTIYRCAAMTK